MITGEPWHYYTNRCFGPNCQNCGCRAVNHKDCFVADSCDDCPCDNYQPIDESVEQEETRRARDQLDRDIINFFDSDNKPIDMGKWGEH